MRQVLVQETRRGSANGEREPLFDDRTLIEYTARPE